LSCKAANHFALQLVTGLINFLCSRPRPDLMPMDYFPDAHPALHLVVYSVNQKGRSEPIVLENVPINEADKRSGRCAKKRGETTEKFSRGERGTSLDQDQSIHCFLSTISPLKSHSSICIFRLTVLVSFFHSFLCCGSCCCHC